MNIYRTGETSFRACGPGCAHDFIDGVKRGEIRPTIMTNGGKIVTYARGSVLFGFCAGCGAENGGEERWA